MWKESQIQSIVLLGPWELYEKKRMKDFQVIQDQTYIKFYGHFFLNQHKRK